MEEYENYKEVAKSIFIIFLTGIMDIGFFYVYL